MGARIGAAPTATAPRIRWLGHATVLVELDGVRLLTDPALGRCVGPLVRQVPPVASEYHAAIDAVLLSHLHGDHADLPSLRRVGRGTTLLVPAGARAWLRRRGFADVRELAEGQAADVGGVRVTATPAAHDGRRLPFGPEAAAIGFLIEGSSTVYFAGDTDLFDGMAELAGRVDAALLPVSGWGPTLPEGHLDAEGAARAAALIHPQLAIPIHWGTLAAPALAPRDAARPALRFATAIALHAPGVEARVLAPGEATEIPCAPIARGHARR